MTKAIGFVTAMLLLLPACERGEPIPATIVSGLFNGTDWQQPGWRFGGDYWPATGVEGEPCDLNAININITHYNPQNYARQSLSIQKIPTQQGQYSLHDGYPCRVNDKVGANFFLLGSDGDVVRAILDVVESAESYLVIEQYDPKGGRLVGRLQATFTPKPRNRSVDTPDTIRITNCRFSIPLRQ
jgi:hypothetical protein